MKAVVLVPWRSGGCLHREAAWRYVRRRYAEAGYVVVPCDDGGQPFSRGCSVNVAAASIPADVYVISDADVVVGLDRLEEAIAAAVAAPGLVVAFDRYRYLTRRATSQVLDRDLPVWEARHDFELADSVGPCVAVSAETFETVGGFDPRLRGWGHEDVCFEVACATLGAPTRRTPGTLYHLWHPTDPVRPKENHELCARYLAAHSKPDEIRALIAEARVPA